jgi:hypothetical protein
VSETPQRTLRQRLKRGFLLTMLAILATAALVFILDFAVFRLRAALNWNPYGSVVVNHYTAVPQKNGKTLLTFDAPQPWTCVNALFPHGGMLPCWYLSRHPDQATNI